MNGRRELPLSSSLSRSTHSTHQDTSSSTTQLSSSLIHSPSSQSPVQQKLPTSTTTKASATRIGYTFSQSSTSSLPGSSAGSSSPTQAPSVPLDFTSSQSPANVTSLSGNTFISTPLIPSSNGASPNTTLDRHGPTSSGVPIGSVKTKAQDTTAAIAGGVVGGLLAAAIILFLLIWQYKRRRGSSDDDRDQTHNGSHYGLKSRWGRPFGGRGSQTESRLSDTSFLSGTVATRGLQISSPMPLMLERERDPRFVNNTTNSSPPIPSRTGQTASSETLVRARALGGHRPQLSHESYVGDIRSRFPDPPRTVNDQYLVPNSKPRIIIDPRGTEYYSSDDPLGDAAISLSGSSIASESLYSNEEGDIGSLQDVMVPSPMSTTQTIRPPRPIRTSARPPPISKV